MSDERRRQDELAVIGHLRRVMAAVEAGKVRLVYAKIQTERHDGSGGQVIEYTRVSMADSGPGLDTATAAPMMGTR